MKISKIGQIILFLSSSSALVLSGCGTSNKETKDSALKRENRVLDVRLFEGATSKPFNKEESSHVGFDSSGLESRTLLYFPSLEALWDEKVIISSIAIVELLISSGDIPVNPENIELYPIRSSWGPFATWNLRDRFFGDKWSSPGGDIDSTSSPVTPSLRVSTGASAAKELAFDITNLVKQMILNGSANYGFLIRVKKSDLNATNGMYFSMSNHQSSSPRPSAILTFSTSNSVEP